MIDLSKLSDKELIELKESTSIEVSKNHNMQIAKKTLLNSGYGAVSNEYFRWFDLVLSEAITVSGQYAIRYIAGAVNVALNKYFKTSDIDYVVAADTDSIYINLEKFREQNPDVDTVGIVDMLDVFAKDRLEPYIAAQYDRLADLTNSYEQKMVMKREAIADKGIWTAKKKYILNVYDNEGVRFTEPLQKITGIEAVRSSTPSSCRKAIKECIGLILTKDEDSVIEYIEDFRTHFKTLPFEEIAFPRSVNNIEHYSTGSRGKLYRSGCPIAVRGAIVYNNWLKKNELDDVHPIAKEGEKIKFCYMKMPNPLHENVISVPQELPKAIDFHKYIDYDVQFEKAFLNPLSSILNAINWKTSDSATLESFFGVKY